MATAGSSNVLELVACVVGLSRGQGEDFTSGQGIGKSCLCFRFFHSDSDEYADDHQSLLALHEFTSPVINSVHFLYWGSSDKTFPSSKGSDKTAQIRFHVIEQTVFYRDETSKPFLSGGRPDDLNNYMRRITGSIESPGKLSYKSFNDIENHTEKQQYPSRISRLPRGFMVLLDVSLSGNEFETQLKRVEFVLDHLAKQKLKFVIVASKRDNCDMDSLELAYKLKRKYRTLLIETSASRNRNVEDAFRVLACKTLQKKLHGVSDDVPVYDEEELVFVNHRDSKKELAKHVTDSGKKSPSIGGRKERCRSTLFGRKAETEDILANEDISHHRKTMSVYYEALGNPPEVNPGFQLEEQDVDISTLSKGLGKRTHFDAPNHHSIPTDIRLQKKSHEIQHKLPPESPWLQGHRVHGDGESIRSKSVFWKDWRTLRQMKQVLGSKGKKEEKSLELEQEPLLLLDEATHHA